MHINEMYEVQAKQLLHKLCDALGIEQQDRTKSGVEKAIASLSSACIGCGAEDELNEASLCDYEEG